MSHFWTALAVFVAFALALGVFVAWQGKMRTAEDTIWKRLQKAGLASLGLFVGLILFVQFSQQQRSAFNQRLMDEQREYEIKEQAFAQMRSEARTLAHGGLLEAVGLISQGASKVPVSQQQYDLWRSSIAFKAYLYELDLSATREFRNDSLSVLDWASEYWHDFDHHAETVHFVLKHKDDDKTEEDLVLTIDLGIEQRPGRSLAGNLDVQLGPPNGMRQLAQGDDYTIEPLIVVDGEQLDSDTLFKLELRILPGDYGACPNGIEGDCVGVQYSFSNSYGDKAGSYSLSLPHNIVTFGPTVDRLRLRHNFSRPPLKLAQLTWHDFDKHMMMEHRPQIAYDFKTSNCSDQGMPAPASWPGRDAVSYCGTFAPQTTKKPPVLAYWQCPQGADCLAERNRVIALESQLNDL